MLQTQSKGFAFPSKLPSAPADLLPDYIHSYERMCDDAVINAAPMHMPRLSVGLGPSCSWCIPSDNDEEVGDDEAMYGRLPTPLSNMLQLYTDATLHRCGATTFY